MKKKEKKKARNLQSTEHCFETHTLTIFPCRRGAFGFLLMQHEVLTKDPFFKQFFIVSECLNGQWQHWGLGMFGTQNVSAELFLNFSPSEY